MLVACFATAQDQRSDLQNLQTLIEQTKAQLEKNLADSERLQQALKLAELEIAQTATQISNTENILNQTSNEISALESQQKTLENKIQRQQGLLAEQLKSAFRAGEYDFAKMLLNQEEANKLSRMLSYYKYINTARQQKIDDFRTTVQELQLVSQRLLSKRSQLEDLQKQQQEQRTKLQKQQNTRIANMRELNKLIESDQSRVQRLEQQEKDLLRIIEEAELVAARLRDQQRSSQTLSGLNGKQGQLLVPTSGRLRALFGKRRQGQINWKGVVFTAPTGTSVQAVEDGKVLFADWLRGFGLVIVVDHGDGYMSVYGHNQALLKSVGDFVQRGDSISLVGASGGQDTSGLYFEIRHKGKALNPSQWLARVNK